MIKAVFFDLDGTLLNLDGDAFLASYVKAVSSRFTGIINPEVFAKELLRWSYAMIGNVDPNLSNLDVFWSGFAPAVGKERAFLEPIFTNFYAQDFCGLKPPGANNPSARRLLAAVVKNGYHPVIATNPVFPKEAILERIRWAQCDDFPYVYITCGEEMHFCKPNLEFFTEILERIGQAPQECLMVGNDVEEDMIAQRLGFKTALVKDCLIDRGKAKIKPDWEGSLLELADIFVSGRENIVFSR